MAALAVYEPVLTMTPPPWSTISGMTALAHRYTPFRLVAISASQASSSISTTEPRAPYPALLTRISIRPWRAAAAATPAVTSAARETSITTAVARSPISRATRSTAAPSRSAMTTSAPSAANSEAVARPMPLAPPVIRATLLARRMRWILALQVRAAGLGQALHRVAAGDVSGNPVVVPGADRLL